MKKNITVFHSHRLDFKTWQVKATEHKQIFECKKKEIQDKFKTKMGLIVDKPKPGYGSSNDGNTARKFFANPNTSSEITGIDSELIGNFATILRILSSGRKVDLYKYKQLVFRTKERYLKLYSWYYMPVTVHKLLLHSSDIMEACELPVGQLSEEALEATHKIIRGNRLKHTRKSSRVNTNTDLMNYMLLSSDPSVSGKRKPVSNNHHSDNDDISSYFVDEVDDDDSFALFSDDK